MNPATIIIHGNQAERVPAAYGRYLENTFRKILKIMGTPIRIEFRSGGNPFAENTEADQRQAHRKRRVDKTAQFAREKRKTKRS